MKVLKLLRGLRGRPGACVGRVRLGRRRWRRRCGHDDQWHDDRGRRLQPLLSPAKLEIPGAVSSVGRAPARQAGGHWFEPSTAHLGKPRYGGVFSFADRRSNRLITTRGNRMATFAGRNSGELGPGGDQNARALATPPAAPPNDVTLRPEDARASYDAQIELASARARLRTCCCRNRGDGLGLLQSLVKVAADAAHAAQFAARPGRKEWRANQH